MEKSHWGQESANTVHPAFLSSPQFLSEAVVVGLFKTENSVWEIWGLTCSEAGSVFGGRLVTWWARTGCHGASTGSGSTRWRWRRRGGAVHPGGTCCSDAWRPSSTGPRWSCRGSRRRWWSRCRSAGTGGEETGTWVTGGTWGGEGGTWAWDLTPTRPGVETEAAQGGSTLRGEEMTSLTGATVWA